MKSATYLFIIIAILGLLIYSFSPQLTTFLRGEGFETTENPGTIDQKAIDNLFSVLSTPNVASDNSGTPSLPAIQDAAVNIPKTLPTLPGSASAMVSQEMTKAKEQVVGAPSTSNESKPASLEESKAESISPAISQGMTYRQNPMEKIRTVYVPKPYPVPRYCPPVPDMNQYVKKDSVPCWACKL
jgi:hypothetical protein